MKAIKLIIILLISANIQVFAQKTAFYIDGESFSQPILKGWIERYNQLYPTSQIAFTEGENKESYLSLVTHQEEEINTPFTLTIPVARYALLPVANQENPLLNELKNKGLDKNRILKLFFEYDLEEEGKYPFKNEAIVYSSTRQQANATLIAGYFNKKRGQLRGKKIAGDDIYLTHAVKRDPQGIAFNYLPYLYNIHTRELEEGINLLPLDLKKDQWQVLSSGLDEALQLLENQKINLIPVYTLSFSLNKNVSGEIYHFIEWILTEGQALNHQYGFLNIDERQKSHLQKQIELAQSF